MFGLDLEMSNLRNIVLNLGLAIACTTNAEEFKRSHRYGGHLIEVQIVTGPFTRGDHKIEMHKGWAYVDGLRTVNTDGGIPKVEIKQFKLMWDGTRVPVPKNAYQCIYNVGVKHAGLFPGGDREVLIVKATESDALMFDFGQSGDAVRSWLWLVICRDGRWHRFEGSDGMDPF